MVGKGPLKENIVKLIADKNLKNVTVFDAIPKKQVQSFLKRCDLLAITWNNSPLYRFGISPNKLFDYMYSGKPVVQSVIAGNDIPKDSGCGITCKPEPAEIVKAILQIYNMSEDERSAMGEKGKEYVLQNHTYSVLAEKFIEAMK
jgi:glycosyltransferase involved in cell wall biosynthesis